MTVARKNLVDVDVTRYYHCISRCVRQANLCGKGFEHRKQWIEDRLELLTGCFAVSVCGFAVLDNHLHALVRLDPETADDWSDEQVIRRWLRVYPPRNIDSENEKSVKRVVDQKMRDPKHVETIRERLTNLGWFMKALKEPLARMANREDDCKGTFWEGRYKSIAVLDEEALLATCAYIDLNPVAAGMAELPETSKYTSIHQRVRHVRGKGQLDKLKAACQGSVRGSQAAGNLEQDHWLCPVEDRRRQGSQREGMLESFSLGSYLLLVDHTSRIFREGKARVGSGVAEIIGRLGSSAEIWDHRMKRLFSQQRLRGSYFSTDRNRLRELAAQKGQHKIANLAACPV